MSLFHTRARQNTGRHMLDSGDYYGRHYDQPPVTEDSPLLVGWPPAIETAVFLDGYFDVLDELQAIADTGDRELVDADTGESLSKPEYVRRLLVAMGHVSVARNNTYNSESDLTQCYIWEVFVPGGHKDEDWLYDQDAVVVIQIHTGCDVRGGYSDPIFCRAKKQCDYAVPIDLRVRFYSDDGHDWDSYYELDKEVETWINNETVILKDGDRVEVHADAPY